MPGPGPEPTVRTVLSSIAGTRSDTELLAAHVAGDRYAFEELFRRYSPQLHRVAGRRLRSPEDAADAVQEAMLAAHRSAPEFRAHSTVSTWLHRIVLNKCIDQLRRPQELPQVLADRDVGPATDATAGVETTIVVHRALAALSADQRAAVVAVDLQGYSVAETAHLLGIAEGTVKSRCSRGRARLAVLLVPEARVA